MVSSLGSHHCGIVRHSAPRGFSPDTLVFSSHQKPTYELIWLDFCTVFLISAAIVIEMKFIIVIMTIPKRLIPGNQTSSQVSTRALRLPTPFGLHVSFLDSQFLQVDRQFL